MSTVCFKHQINGAGKQCSWSVEDSLYQHLGFAGLEHPRWHQWLKNPPANSGDKKHQFNPWVRKIPWRRTWQSTPVFLFGETHGQRSLAGYSSQSCKQSDTSEAVQHACTLSCSQNLNFVVRSRRLSAQRHQEGHKPRSGCSNSCKQI